MKNDHSAYVQKLKKEGTLNYFYVYAYLRKDGTPYYIGKGQGYRMHDRYGHPGLPPRDRRVKLKENLFEEEALQLEEELILKYGRKKYDKGGILYNMAIGGETRTVWRTLEEKKKSKSESDKRYRENPKYREGMLQRKKEYYLEHREEILAKEKAWRATPEGKAKKAAMDKAYYIKVRQDPVRLEVDRKRKREHAYKKAREQGKPTKEEIGRKFKVVSPDGKVYEGIQCKPFAEKHNLDPVCFTAMVRGVITHYHGWKVYGFKPPEGKKQRSNGGYFPIRIKNSKQFSFKMIDPQGNIHEGFNQREFSEKHGLNYKNVNGVLKEKKKSTEGWRLYKG